MESPTSMAWWHRYNCNSTKAKNMIKNLIDNFENYIDPKDPTNNCLDVAIITSPEKRTKNTIEKLSAIAGRVLKK